MSADDKIQGPFPVKENVPPDYELKQLIKRCIARERLAQKQLYDQYAPAMYSVVRRYIYSDHIVQEVMNDAFFKVFTNLEQYAHQGAFGGWIRRIFVNTIMDRLRRDRKEREILHTKPAEEDGLIESEAITNMSFKELLLHIHELPEMHRTVFNMYVFDDFTHKEIALQLLISEVNCRWYLKDARRRLREKIINAMKPKE